MADTYAYNDVAEQPTKTKVKDSGCVKVAVQIMEEGSASKGSDILSPEPFIALLEYTEGTAAHAKQRLRSTVAELFVSSNPTKKERQEQRHAEYAPTLPNSTGNPNYRYKRAFSMSLYGDERPILDEIESLIGCRLWTARRRTVSLHTIPTIVLKSPEGQHIPRKRFVPEHNILSTPTVKNDHKTTASLEQPSNSSALTLLTTIVNAAPIHTSSEVACRPLLRKTPNFVVAPLRPNANSSYDHRPDDSEVSSEESRDSSSTSCSDSDEDASPSKSRYRLGSPMSRWLLRTQKNSQPVTPKITPASGESTGYFHRPVTVRDETKSSNDMIIELPYPTSSIGSPPSYMQADPFLWTVGQLTKYTDETRFMLHHRIPTSAELHSTLSILRSLLEAETNSGSKIDLRTISITRLDKLLEDILATEKNIANLLPTEEIFAAVRALTTAWEGRFGKEYGTMDEIRLKLSGTFRDVVVNHFARGINDLFIVVRNNTRSLPDEQKIFKPGDWWLNQSCAYRDGITTSTTCSLDNDPVNGITLFLLKGYEVNGDCGRQSIYHGKGTNQDVPTLLVKCNMGKPIRVVRGFGLDSEFAPKAGIRYDGFYKVKLFGHKYHGNALWTWKIGLEQHGDDNDMRALHHIPRPSQLDDWDLYLAMIDADRQARFEELEKAREDLKERQGAEWDRQMVLLRTSIQVAFGGKEMKSC